MRQLTIFFALGLILISKGYSQRQNISITQEISLNGKKTSSTIGATGTTTQNQDFIDARNILEEKDSRTYQILEALEQYCIELLKDNSSYLNEYYSGNSTLELTIYVEPDSKTIGFRKKATRAPENGPTSTVERNLSKSVGGLFRGRVEKAIKGFKSDLDDFLIPGGKRRLGIWRLFGAKENQIGSRAALK